MPILLEEELSDLHHQIETHKTRANQFEEELKDVKIATEKHKRHKIILIIVLAILAILLIVSGIMYQVNPEILVNKTKLEQQGTIVLSSHEYEQTLAEVKESARIAFAEENQNNENTTAPVEEASLDEMIIYSVQIGAFEEKGLQVYSENFIQFKEIYNDDFYKYSIGVFETLEEAQGFRKEIVNLGFEDAFIASYSNGNRLKIEEAY